jgi:hypothetical protein
MEKLALIGRNNMKTNQPTFIDTSLDIDRPDVIKRQGSPTLTFKEIKDALFKFLMQTEIRFASFEKVNLPVEFRSKTDGTSFIINNTTYYTVTCRLLDIKVDNHPVYVVVIPTAQFELEKRQLSKLLYLKKMYKIVVFDKEDCKQVGIDISDKSWLGSLNKNILKKWSKLLFQKISQLGSNVESKYNLNDIYRKIDNNAGKTGESSSKVTIFKQEGLELKYKILKNKLEYIFPKLKTYPVETLTYLAKIDKGSSEWLETLFNYILQQIVRKIDLRKNYYKDFFRRKNGEIDIANKEKICELVGQVLSKKLKMDITNLGYGTLRIQDKKTFQTSYIIFESTKSETTRGIKLNENLLRKINSNVFHYLNLTFFEKSGKLYQAKGYLFTTDKHKNYKDSQLQIYDSEKLEKYQIYLLD